MTQLSLKNYSPLLKLAFVLTWLAAISGVMTLIQSSTESRNKLLALTMMLWGLANLISLISGFKDGRFLIFNNLANGIRNNQYERKTLSFYIVVTLQVIWVLVGLLFAIMHLNSQAL